jgi:hypothetical protein
MSEAVLMVIQVASVFEVRRKALETEELELRFDPGEQQQIARAVV